MIRIFISRLFATLLPKYCERRLNDEIEQHLDQLAAHQSAQGLKPENARLAARREFGAVEPAKELYRDQARFRTLENVLRDFRLALRQCRKNPGFTAAAVISLALGIGANTALFSFVNAILLKRLPVPSPDRLVLLKNSGSLQALSYTQLNEIDRRSTELDGLAGVFALDVRAALGDHPQ